MKYTLIILSAFISTMSFAQEEEPKAVYIKKGDPAPFSGTILNNSAQAKVIAEKQYAIKECELKSSYDLLKMRTEKDLEINKIKIDLDIMNKKYDAVVNIKDQEIKRLTDLTIKMEGSDKYRWLYFVGGFVAGSAAIIGLSYAVNR